MKNIISFVDVNIDDNLKRHPINIKMFGASEPAPSKLEWLHRTYEQFGKLKPIYVIQQVIEGVTITYIIDGYKSRLVLEQMGITRLKVAVLNITEEKDIAQVIVELQKSHHTSLVEEYSTYETLYGVFEKGKGHRSDLTELSDNDAEEPSASEDVKKARRENVYDVIGKMCGVSRNRVQYIIKVGRVNPHHFERIELERYPLYQAYLKCIAEEKGEEPPVPPAKAPVYVSDATQPPSYTNTSATTHNGFTEPKATNAPVENVDESAAKVPAVTNTAPQENDNGATGEFMILNLPVSRVQLQQVDTTQQPIIKVDGSDPQFVTITVTFSKTK